MRGSRIWILFWGLLVLNGVGKAQQDGPGPRLFQPMDVFQLEYASDPQISPDGRQVAYVRNSMDIQKDRRRGKIWIVDVEGKRHVPLTSETQNEASPRWSPDGKRLLYIASEDGSNQIYSRLMEGALTLKLTQLTEDPRNLAWSPDGQWIAFTMMVREQPKSFVAMPAAPEGAEWSPPPVVIDKMLYREDGDGYLPHGFSQLFV